MNTTTKEFDPATERALFVRNISALGPSPMGDVLVYCCGVPAADVESALVSTILGLRVAEEESEDGPLTDGARREISDDVRDLVETHGERVTVREASAYELVEMLRALFPGVTVLEAK
jgi:hypothetical protein